VILPTVQVREIQPLPRYCGEEVKRFLAGKKTFTALSACRAELTPGALFWLVLREAALPVPILQWLIAGLIQHVEPVWRRRMPGDDLLHSTRRLLLAHIAEPDMIGEAHFLDYRALIWRRRDEHRHGAIATILKALNSMMTLPDPDYDFGHTVHSVVVDVLCAAREDARGKQIAGDIAAIGPAVADKRARDGMARSIREVVEFASRHTLEEIRRKASVAAWGEGEDDGA